MSNNFLFTVSKQNRVIGKQNLVNAPRMNESEKAKIIGKNVAAARDAKGWSQAELASKIGAKSANTVGSIETGNTRKSKYLPDIADVLGVKIRDFFKGIPDLDQAFKQKELSIIPSDQIAGAIDLDVYGTTEGGDGILVVSNAPVDKARRPTSVVNVSDAYGVIVTGESMIPKVRPGNVVIVNPHLPPMPDDLCLFKREEHGAEYGCIKEYRGQTKDSWRVRRYSPKIKDFELRKRDWPICQVVVSIELKRR